MQFDNPSETRLEAVFYYGVVYVIGISFFILAALPYVYGTEFTVTKKVSECVVATHGSGSFDVCDPVLRVGSVVLLDRRSGRPVRRDFRRLLATGSLPILLTLWIVWRY